jgi:hypothetical protein
MDEAAKIQRGRSAAEPRRSARQAIEKGGTDDTRDIADLRRASG